MARKSYADVLEKDPTKKVSAEEKIGTTTQKLSESDRRALVEQVRQKEEEILAAKDLNKDADVSNMQREMNHKKMILQHDDDLRPKSDTQRDRLAARASELEAILKRSMPTKREMWAKSGTTESAQAVRHLLKHQVKHSADELEWKDIQNKLNPDDPDAASLELIRPE